MQAITLESIQAKQTELAALIKSFTQSQTTNTVSLPEIEFELRAGDHYAGPVLDADGEVQHHLILLAEKPTGKLTWQAAMDWAESIGAHLPNRQEQALLFANCKPHLQPAWHWSCETDEDDASYAWLCTFYHGNQTGDHKSFEGSAVAVRRF